VSDIQQELLAAFDAEHREHIEAIRHVLQSAAEGRSVDLNDAFRRAHSLKGASRAVGFPQVEELAHRLETIFTRLLDGSLVLDRHLGLTIGIGLDAVEEEVAALQEGRSSTLYEKAVDALGTLIDPAPPPARSVAPAPAGEPDATEKASAAPVEYLRIPATELDHLETSSTGLVAALQSRAEVSRRLGEIEGELRALRQRAYAIGRRQHDQKILALSRDLDAFGRRVGALARAERSTAWSIDHAVRVVREDVDRMALVPVDTVFGTFRRMTRELAHSEGREVEVDLSGLEIKASRQILQELKDPVLHLVRNAIGHGIENAEVRRAAGKDERGCIWISFSTRSGRLNVSVRDDGRGPDLDRIRDVAAERGLLDPTLDHGGYPEAYLLSLVFEPGFSTAAQVGRLSGRGMGLSVVAEAARRLGGNAVMRPVAKGGTEILIAVPLSAALQSVLLVEDQGRQYGIPSYGVERLLRLPLGAIGSLEGRAVTRLWIGENSVVVPLVPLSALVDGATAELPVEAGHVKGLLVSRGPRRCILAVTGFSDARLMTIASVEAFEGDRELVAGAVIADDGVPALVLDPDGLLERWLAAERGQGRGTGLGVLHSASQTKETTILVVDDSITTRTLEKSILEAQGYRVILGVDGLDGLEKLRAAEDVVDLVVADVEMPRMDGFSLLQAIRNDARFARLPFVLMTSRAAPEDVRKGLELGADAYITKQKFDQRELLATIGRLL
jgi:two-component system chemotaxis sensor kinase CheA